MFGLLWLAAILYFICIYALIYLLLFRCNNILAKLLSYVKTIRKVSWGNASYTIFRRHIWLQHCYNNEFSDLIDHVYRSSRYPSSEGDWHLKWFNLRLPMALHVDHCWKRPEQSFPVERPLSFQQVLRILSHMSYLHPKIGKRIDNLRAISSVAASDVLYIVEVLYTYLIAQ